ncbi:MAG: hypothetical protein ACR2H1_10590, partial [Limisphaerales bacterium]
MKRRLLFFISLAINILLFWAIVRARQNSVGTVQPQIQKGNVVQVETNFVKENISFAAPAEKKFSWLNVEPPDYREYLANLRAINCPEETIRDIIIADISRDYYKKLLAHFRTRKTTGHYWESKNQDGWWEEQKVPSKIRRERDALIRELLGGEVWQEMQKWFEGTNQNDYWNFISKEKLDQIQVVSRKYSDIENEIKSRTKGYWVESAEAELKQLPERKRAEMEQILSPNDLEEYEMRESKAADYVRREWLEGFDATEQEYR